MTKETYDRAMGILSDKEICTFAERICEHYHFEPLKMYPKTVDSAVMPSAARRMMYVHRTCDLLRRAIFLGASSLEVLRIARYLVVIMKSFDHLLNYKLCEMEENIPELSMKYSEEEFLKLDVPIEWLEDVIERDKDFYGVKYK